MFSGLRIDTPTLGEIQDELSDTVYYVARQETYGIHFIPMEEYLVGLTAANIPIEYEDEAIKAQITVLRSIILFYADEKGENKNNSNRYIFCREEELNLHYADVTYLKSEWENDYETNYRKIAGLILDTKGIYISYKDQPIDASFCAVSAGWTRTGPDEYPYLQSVECGDDIFSDDYVSRVSYTIEEWKKLLHESVTLFAKEDVTDIEILSKDKWGYVTTVRIGDKQMMGEAFRILAGLSSACFNYVINEEEIVFTVNGNGHGYGMSLYTAEQLAIDGQEFRTILNFFFDDVVFKKIE